MTIKEMSEAREGRDLWLYYVKINGYAFEPDKAGIDKIAHLLDLTPQYIKHRINVYLEA